MLGEESYTETRLDFVGRRKLWFTISLVAVLIGLVSLATRGLNLGIDFEGGVVWEVPAGRRLGGRRPQRRRAVRPGGRHRSRSSTSDDGRGCGSRPSRSSADDQRPGHRRPRRAHRVVGRRREPQRPWARRGAEEISDKALRALIVFLVAGHDLHRVPVRVEDGDPHAGRPHPRRADHGRRVLDHRPRGHAGHGDRACSRSSATRSTTASSCSTRSTRTPGSSSSTRRPDLRRHGQRVAEPGADALAQHDDHRPAAGGVAARRRLVRSSGATTLEEFALALLIGLFVGRVLVDLHRLAAAGACSRSASPATATSSARIDARGRRLRGRRRHGGRGIDGRRPGPARQPARPTRDAATADTRVAPSGRAIPPRPRKKTSAAALTPPHWGRTPVRRPPRAGR